MGLGMGTDMGTGETSDAAPPRTRRPTTLTHVRTHRYELTLAWQGNRGTGTSASRAYDRTHEVSAPGKPPIPGSSDPAFRGEPDRWNPEELLVAALAQCHLLWFLDLSTRVGVVVTDYSDAPLGTMTEDDAGAGQFTEVRLRPQVCVAQEAMVDRAQALHADVGQYCFIARSVAFPVRLEPTTRASPA